jgi:UDP-glucose 4-epimerase
MSTRPLILVIGGAGFIGSHVNYQLHQAGYDTVIFDNLCRGKQEAVVAGKLIVGELSDANALDHTMKQYQFDAIMHFAAYTDVGASVQQPGLYYQNNVTNSLILLEAAVRHNIDTVIFSSSAAIFGLPIMDKITEDHPQYPISPYGRSKLMVEHLLADFATAHGIRFCALRYFNAAGGDPTGTIKSYPRPEHNLIPRLLWALRAGKNRATIFGSDYPTHDGTCVRDYIHVWDLAQAHLLALSHLQQGGSSACYNLGNGQGFTVREVLTAIEQVTGHQLQIHITARRPGDPAVLIADSTKACQELGWSQHYPDLHTMVEHAWNAMCNDYAYN